MPHLEKQPTNEYQLRGRISENDVLKVEQKAEEAWNKTNGTMRRVGRRPRMHQTLYRDKGMRTSHHVSIRMTNIGRRNANVNATMGM